MLQDALRGKSCQIQKSSQPLSRNPTLILEALQVSEKFLQSAEINDVLAKTKSGIQHSQK